MSPSPQPSAPPPALPYARSPPGCRAPTVPAGCRRFPAPASAASPLPTPRCPPVRPHPCTSAPSVCPQRRGLPTGRVQVSVPRNDTHYAWSPRGPKPGRHRPEWTRGTGDRHDTAGSCLRQRMVAVLTFAADQALQHPPLLLQRLGDGAWLCPSLCRGQSGWRTKVGCLSPGVLQPSPDQPWGSGGGVPKLLPCRKDAAPCGAQPIPAVEAEVVPDTPRSLVGVPCPQTPLLACPLPGGRPLEWTMSSQGPGPGRSRESPARVAKGLRRVRSVSEPSIGPPATPLLGTRS